MGSVIVLHSDAQGRPAQRPASQVIVPASKRGAAQENQHFRPRVLRKWALRQTIWQIAQQERRLPSEIELVLWEELAPHLQPAQTRRAA